MRSSFSTQVKEELSGVWANSRHCQLAELAAIIHFCCQVTYKDGKWYSQIQSENESVTRKYFTLLKKTFNIDTNVEKALQGVRILEDQRQIRDTKDEISPLLLKNSCCRRAYIRGAFLSIGSISDPAKGYHLEFVCNNDKQAAQLQNILQSFTLDAKTVARKRYFVVYIKEGAGIVDTLNIMGAHHALMNLENLRIEKEVRNSVNRKVNCEAANIKKTVDASTRQVEDILLIQEKKGLKSLPDNLREIAEVRIQYPDATLKELGEYLNPEVGKSGVNHRLRKLSEIAEKMR